MTGGRPISDDGTGPMGVLLEYRLTEADVRRFCSSGRARACWQSCRDRRWAMTALAAVGLSLVGSCWRAHGIRPAALALGTTLAVLTALALAREAWSRRRVVRLARDLGIPCDLRLDISPGGIAKAPGEKPSDPGRTFAWSEVVDLTHGHGLTIIRLRPAGGALLIPDRAFPTAEARGRFAADARAWRDAAVPDPGPTARGMNGTDGPERL